MRKGDGFQVIREIHIRNHRISLEQWRVGHVPENTV